MADPAISIAYLETRLSGGSANTDPNASLGGDISSERVLSQSSSALSNVTGVTIDYAGGNDVGAGTLTYTFTGKTLQWTPFGGTIGPAVAVGVTDGRYTIKGGNAGFLLVTVATASLAGSDKSDSVTIANIANEEYDDVSKAESFSGDTEYRCIYYKNAHDADPFLDLVLYIPTQPTPGTISIGKDPAGAGDGTNKSVSSITRSGSTATATSTAHGFQTGQSNVKLAGADQPEYNGTFTITVDDADHFHYTVTGTPATPATGTITASRGRAPTVADEGTAPSGVTFSNPSSAASGISLGQLNPGESIPVWFKRNIPVKNTTANSASLAKISAQAYY